MIQTNDESAKLWFTAGKWMGVGLLIYWARGYIIAILAVYGAFCLWKWHQENNP